MDVIFQPPTPTNHKHNWLGVRLRAVLRQLSRPKMFAYMLYAIQFVVLMGASTTCLQFGAMVIVADHREPQYQQRLMRFFATTILSVVCLILYFNTYYFRKLNIVFACLKCILIIVIVGKAAHFSHTHGHPGFRVLPELQNASPPKVVSHFNAFLNVLFAYSGWENATFVP